MRYALGNDNYSLLFVNIITLFVQNRIFLINNYLSPHESRVIVGNGIK